MAGVKVGRLPLARELVRLADEDALCRGLGDLNAVRGAAVAVVHDAQAVLHERERLALLHFGVPPLANDGDGQVGAVASGDEVFLVGGANEVDVAEKGGAAVKARDEELVPERVHLVAAVVHDGAQKAENLRRVAPVAVVLIQVFLIHILQPLDNGLKVADFPRSTNQRVGPHALDAAHILVARHVAVRRQGVRGQHHTALVL